MFRFILLSTAFISTCYANTPQQNYVDKFNQYQTWQKSLPLKPTADFLQFIHQNGFLAQKLREQWLDFLGQKKDWQLFRENYQLSSKISLQCYSAFASYSLGFQKQALNAAKNIWLSADTRPQVCKPLFDILLKSPKFNENMFDERIILAINKGNISLVSYLLSQYKVPKKNYIDLLTKIQRDPAAISLLYSQQTNFKRDTFAGYFYVYSLKKLVEAQRTSILLRLWKTALTKNYLTEEQKQSFIVYYASYLARHYDERAINWFSQIKSSSPDVYELEMNLKIRLALIHKDWHKIITLCSANSVYPSWQYWLARALESTGNKEKAQNIYKKLADNKNYYGFLANTRLNQQPTLNIPKLNTLVPKEYIGITNNIITLNKQNHEDEAFALFKDFISDLPKHEKIALLYWASNTLRWYDKVIALCNNDELKEQLYLRFPLAYKDIIIKFAHAYNLPVEFVYAVIRQESSFKPNIFSAAGAIGLMQIMPDTASSIAKRKHIRYKNSKDLINVKLNIQLGCAYLAMLNHEYFHNNLIFATAAYNAGPSKVKLWLKTLSKDKDIFIDTMPFDETREYLKNIIVFFVIYQAVDEKHPRLTDMDFANY